MADAGDDNAIFRDAARRFAAAELMPRQEAQGKAGRNSGEGHVVDAAMIDGAALLTAATPEPAPRPGQDTRDVLADWGFTDGEIESPRSVNAIA